MKRYLMAIVLAVFVLGAGSASASSVKVPDPHFRNAKIKQMYACNKQPAKWTKRELQCVVRIGFGSEASNAEKIISCESVWTPSAVSHTSDYGLFQINRRWNGEGWRKGANIFDPVWNTRIAYYFWQTRGWKDWVCSRVL
jgi:hypothetical protein